MSRAGVFLASILAPGLAVLAFGGLQSAPAPPSGTPATPSGMTATEIFHRLDQANAIRSEKLKSYSSKRIYSVFEPNKPPDAALAVQMQFIAPSTKIFKTLSQEGVGFVHKLVFNELIKAEQQTASGKGQSSTSISPDNYIPSLAGEDTYLGRATWVLDLQPKREDKYLMIGKIWVDKEDFAITRVEGDPMKNLSWWVTRSHLIREYQKIGDFWLQLRDETDCRIRFVGPYFLRIEYSDYKIEAAE